MLILILMFIIIIKVKIEANLNTNNYYTRISITTNLNLDSIKNEHDDSLFQRCYYTCESCEIEGNNINHNCLKCNSNYSFEIYKNNYPQQKIKEIIKIILYLQLI